MSVAVPYTLGTGLCGLCVRGVAIIPFYAMPLCHRLLLHYDPHCEQCIAYSGLMYTLYSGISLPLASVAFRPFMSLHFSIGT